MEVYLYNSTVCRLCGEENDNGTLLYSSEENNQKLCDIINTYLPLKVSDDGQLPRTICPGCTIQLEATVEFLNLIINGQKIIRDLHSREQDYKKNLLKNSEEPEIISENIVYEINTSDGVYQVEHPVALQVAGLDKPKRKRGRPPKKHKTPEELAKQAANAKVHATNTAALETKDNEEASGKRRRKTPTRFKGAVQGKELERIFVEEGVIDEVEMERENKPEVEIVKPQPKEPQVIGHIEDSGELVVIVEGNSRGRPKGRSRQARSMCGICGLEFTSSTRYMAHIASHNMARHRCGCGRVFAARQQLAAHLASTGHARPQNATKEISEYLDQKDDIKEPTKLEISQTLPSLDTDPLKIETETEQQRVPDKSEEKGNEKTAENSDLTNEKSNNKTSLDNESGTEETKKRKLKCHHCDKMYSSKQSRSLHIKAAHLGERSYACIECGATFAYPRSLALHRVSHRRARPAGYACDLCGKILNHPSSVTYHKQTEHASKRYICGTCGKDFRHKQLLQRHQVVHSQIRPFTCSICGETFKVKTSLMNHLILHTGVKKFGCLFCKMRFAHKTSLTLHMRWHTGVKPYSCSTCGKSFAQRGNLSEHERIHTGVKPYQCGLCPRRFTTSSQHRLHQRRHLQTRYSTVRGRREPGTEAAQKRNVTRKNKMGHKQVSLLVDKNVEQVEAVTVVETTGLSEESRVVVEEDEGEEEQVIYVAYESNGRPAFHVIPQSPEEVAEEVAAEVTEVIAGEVSEVVAGEVAEVVAGEMAEVAGAEEEAGARWRHWPAPALHLTTELDDKPEQHLAVTDGQGNPLHFTMQDGTQLAISSVDGKSLQVITEDGQTIPVEINGYADEESLIDSAAQPEYFAVGNLLNIWKK